jgi:hypothetical protein
MDAPDYVSGVSREVRFALVRCYGENDPDRIAWVRTVVELAGTHGATTEIIGETCVLTYGAFDDAPGSGAAMLALVHDLCTASLPASVVHGMRRCVVAVVGSDERFALQTRIPGFREFMSQLDDLRPGDVCAV